MRLLLALLLVSMAWPALACDTTLKPGDSSIELSAKLKCLDDRISALEGRRPPADPDTFMEKCERCCKRATAPVPEGYLQRQKAYQKCFEGCTTGQGGVCAGGG